MNENEKLGTKIMTRADISRVGSDSDRSVDKTLRSNKLATSADRSADIGWSLAIGIVHLKLLVFFMQWM